MLIACFNFQVNFCLLLRILHLLYEKVKESGDHLPEQSRLVTHWYVLDTHYLKLVTHWYVLDAHYLELVTHWYVLDTHYVKLVTQ